LLRPYSDAPDEWGFLLSSPDYFAEAAKRLYAMGFQMNTHAIGDSANRTLLNIYATYSNRENDLRWRIEHAQVVHPDDFVKFQQSNVIPSVQPTHATSDMYWAGERLGEERLPFAYAYQLLLQQSGTLALGTDFPVEGISPFKTFYAAVGRRDAEAYPPDGFNPEQALTREEALRGMTLWAAHAQFEENEKGSLAIGKFADFTILDRDILEVPVLEILNAKVVKTFVNGTCVYDNKN
jgi:predicted amidohydrolase YtcJ